MAPLLSDVATPYDTLRWELHSVSEIQDELNRLRDDVTGGEMMASRTSVMTQVAWVPTEWREPAFAALEGLRDAHPSRLVLLFPEPDEAGEELLGAVSLITFERGGRQISTEVIAVSLRIKDAARTASTVLPLVRNDLPVFLRWRGDPCRTVAELDALVKLADRLIVDSREWHDLRAAAQVVSDLHGRVVVSDVNWLRLERWRRGVADLWPEVRSADAVHVRGPRADAELLAAWLGARLGRAVALHHDAAGELEAVSLPPHGEAVPGEPRLSEGELLSHQLEIVARDAVYEEAACALSAVTTS